MTEVKEFKEFQSKDIEIKKALQENSEEYFAVTMATHPDRIGVYDQEYSDAQDLDGEDEYNAEFDVTNIYVIGDSTRFLAYDESDVNYYHAERIMMLEQPSVNMAICCVFVFKDMKKCQDFDRGKFRPWIVDKMGL